MFRNGLCIAVVGFNLAYGTWANQAFGQAAECATASTTATDAAVCRGCPCKGDCDAPGIRNQYVPSSLATDVHMKVRVNINYFNSGMTTDIAAQRDKIIDDFRAHHIDLDVDLIYRDDSGYQTIDSQNECEDMRTEWADTTKLNVYVAAMDFLNGSLGRAVFPWESDALTDQGGVLVDISAYGADRTTMTHEIGHALGLWHTSHGTTLSEMNNNHGTCTGGLCNCEYYEKPDCSPYCNEVGDFCGDTPPTPGNFSCADPGGEEICTPYTEWGETDFENFMGFAEDSGSPPFCRSQFTLHQAQRMHCWACDRLEAWIDDEDCNENGNPDICDISRSVSGDCNENAIPDECEVLGKCCIPEVTCLECSTEGDCDLESGFWSVTGNCLACAMPP